MKRLVLVGGGHSHVEVIRRIGLQPSVGVHVTLISAQRHAAYSGMLPGLIAGHYRYQDCHIDLEALCAASSVQWTCDTVVALDPARRTLDCASGARIGYDVASLDIGSAAPPDPARPVAGGAVAIKPTETFLDWWDALRARARTRPLRLLTVGGGSAGVEVTLAMQHRLRAEGVHASSSLATRGATILEGYCAAARRHFERVLRERGIGVLVGARVTAFEDGVARLDSGARMEIDALLWALGPTAAAWPGRSGLATDEDGFVLVDRHLRSVSHPEVFAAGDIASLAQGAHPKSGVYAVRHGPPLAENLRRTLAGERRLVSYVPQRFALALISTGDRRAVAAWGPWSAHGAWVWRWKDRIDRGFVARYRRPQAA